MPVPASEREITFPSGDATLPGILSVPSKPRGMVVFAHGSGSNYKSTRNSDTASVLHGAGFATLRADLLTAEESALNERTGQYRFDVATLSERVLAASTFVGTVAETQ